MQQTALITALAFAPPPALSQTPPAGPSPSQSPAQPPGQSPSQTPVQAVSPAASPAADEALPPDAPQIGFAVEYRLERNLGGRFEWGRRRLFVSGARLRDELLDGDVDTATVLADTGQALLLRYLPDDPARLAHRQAWNEGKALPPIATGYGPLQQRLGPPRPLGERQIAGQTCQRLVWETVGERHEWCVTAQGIALAAKRNAGANETRIEALLVELNTPDPSLFELPQGFSIVAE